MSNEKQRTRIAVGLSVGEVTIFSGCWQLKVIWEHRRGHGSRSDWIKIKEGKQLDCVL